MIERFNLALISDFRRRAGMTQQQLAFELGTTRIQICMAEKMQRPLSISAELKFIELLKLYPVPEDLPTHRKQELVLVAEQEAKEEFMSICDRKLIEVRHFSNLEKKKLAFQQKKYEKESENIRLIEASIAANPGEARLAKRWEEMTKKLKSCSHLAQMETQYAIDLYDLEEQLLIWKLEENGGKEASGDKDYGKEQPPPAGQS